MTRHGEDIRVYPLSGGVNAGIEYSVKFEEAEACIDAGLDYYRWDMGLYPPEFKARVIARYRLHNLIQSHTDVAVAKAQADEVKRHGN